MNQREVTVGNRGTSDGNLDTQKHRIAFGFSGGKDPFDRGPSSTQHQNCCGKCCL